MIYMLNIKESIEVLGIWLLICCLYELFSNRNSNFILKLFCQSEQLPGHTVCTRLGGSVKKKYGKYLYYLWDGLVTVTHKNKYLYAACILLVHMCCKPHTDNGAKDPVSGQNDCLKWDYNLFLPQESSEIPSYPKHTVKSLTPFPQPVAQCLEQVYMMLLKAVLS